MSTRSLPGFYYDEAKGRYFKIQPNHAVPPGSRYSKESVQREAEQKMESAGAFKQGRVRLCGQVEPSRILNHALGGFGLLQERAQMPKRPNSISRHSAWARGLAKVPILPNEPIVKIQYDTANHVTFYSMGREINFLPPSYDTTTPPGLAWQMQDGTSLVSMDMTPSRFCMVTTNRNPKARITVFQMPEAGMPFDCEILGDYHYITFRSAMFVAATPRPDPSITEFAATTLGDIMRVVVREDHISATSYDIQQGSDILAVHWLDDKVLLSGLRNGVVVFWDTREDVHARSTPLASPSCVNHIRTLDSNKIVVAGLENKLNLYDRRYLRPSTEPFTTTTRFDGDDPSPWDETAPYLTFPNYQNVSHLAYQSGFDVHPESNLIASAVSKPYTGRAHREVDPWHPTMPSLSTNEGVQIFDAGTGQELGLGEWGDRPLVETERSESDPVGERRGDVGGTASCLKFVEKEEGPLSLLVATPEGSSRGLHEWTWTSREGN